jgi:hypothetical protein
VIDSFLLEVRGGAVAMLPYAVRMLKLQRPNHDADDGI